MVEGERTLEGAVVKFDGRLQLLQNQGEVILVRLHRDDLGMGLGFLYGIFRFDNIRKGVEIALQLKGLFNQALRVLICRDRKGFDDLLAAIQILHHGICRHLQCKRRDRHGQRQQYTENCFFHVVGTS